MERIGFQRTVVLLLVGAISLLFLGMIRPFLMTLLLAGILAGLSQPLYRRLLRGLGGRVRVAALLTTLVVVAVVLVPLLGVLGIVTAQALEVSQTVIPWVESHLEDPGTLIEKLESSPLGDRLAPHREQIVAKAGEMVGAVSRLLFDSLSATTRGTVELFFQLGLLLYALFFLISDGHALLRKILHYLPLEHEDEERMLTHFTSVTRATLKGTLLIGLFQGALAGAAFAVAGIDGAVFWATLMALLSIVPGIGTGLVWAPAALVLILSGHTGAGIGLALWCAVVVGSVDNVLRPRLVGRDTQMHDLLILFSTLGGVLMFGPLGFVIGPIVAALFVTVWEIYGVAFAEVLPPVLMAVPENVPEEGTEDEAERSEET